MPLQHVTATQTYTTEEKRFKQIYIHLQLNEMYELISFLNKRCAKFHTSFS
jgi:hypothetical protein